jgi:hypothetical protein
MHGGAHGKLYGSAVKGRRHQCRSRRHCHGRTSRSGRRTNEATTPDGRKEEPALAALPRKRSVGRHIRKHIASERARAARSGAVEGTCGVTWSYAPRRRPVRCGGGGAARLACLPRPRRRGEECEGEGRGEKGGERISSVDL